MSSAPDLTAVLRARGARAACKAHPSRAPARVGARLGGSVDASGGVGSVATNSLSSSITVETYINTACSCVSAAHDRLHAARLRATVPSAAAAGVVVGHSGHLPACGCLVHHRRSSADPPRTASASTDGARARGGRSRPPSRPFSRRRQKISAETDKGSEAPIAPCLRSPSRCRCAIQRRVSTNPNPTPTSPPRCDASAVDAGARRVRGPGQLEARRALARTAPSCGSAKRSHSAHQPMSVGPLQRRRVACRESGPLHAVEIRS